ncbi:hypothetical protein D3C77_641950 [compost metagenome]
MIAWSFFASSAPTPRDPTYNACACAGTPNTIAPVRWSGTQEPPASQRRMSWLLPQIRLALRRVAVIAGSGRRATPMRLPWIRLPSSMLPSPVTLTPIELPLKVLAPK